MKALALLVFFAISPNELRSLLDRAERIELLALDPHSEGGEFHGYVVQKTVTLEGKAKGEAVAAVDRAIMRKAAFTAACFYPRHGMRAVVDGKPVELLICFECATMYVFRGESKQRMNVEDHGQPPLDKLLGAQLPR